MFSHLKLKVCQKALASITRLAELSASWDRRHAVVDQLQRASESIVLNIAEGARLRAVSQKQHVLVEFMRWFHALPAGAELSSRLYRHVDKAGTSIVLNMAEDNGRFPPEDRRRFLDLAEAGAVKAAAYLDLCRGQAGLDAGQRERGVDLLGQVVRLVRGLSESC